jgi:hypothetical protein
MTTKINMNKLIISACAITFAIVTQAATVSWGSGKLYKAANENGGWSTQLINADPQAVVTISLYLLDEATFTTVAAKDQAGIYEWAASQTVNYTAQNTMDTVYGNIIVGAATVSIDDAPAAYKKYYSVLTAKYTDSTYGSMYMATTATLETDNDGAGSASNIFGGDIGVRNWQHAVAEAPEPTSGLLILLGVAGLALKRKTNTRQR